MTTRRFFVGIRVMAKVLLYSDWVMTAARGHVESHGRCIGNRVLVVPIPAKAPKTTEASAGAALLSNQAWQR